MDLGVPLDHGELFQVSTKKRSVLGTCKFVQSQTVQIAQIVRKQLCQMRGTSYESLDWGMSSLSVYLFSSDF